jgi:hypothetical protein
MTTAEQTGWRADPLQEMCTSLFVSFCERRNILGLAYMMHAWPMPEQTSEGQRRLLLSLGELGKWHRSELIDSEKALIIEIVAVLSRSTSSFASDELSSGSTSIRLSEEVSDRGPMAVP